MKRIILILGLVGFFFNLSQYTYADWRRYVWTYEYMTMRKGTFELENYLTTVVSDTGKSNVNIWKYWIELEYGITDHWDISMYQQFKQSNRTNGSDFEYDGFKIRTRYRIGEKDEFFLDPLLYLEYIRDDNFSRPNILEAKLILAKDVDRFNLSYNQILKQEVETRGETEHEYAFGVNYAISNRSRLGIESKGNYTEEKYSLGPTISFAKRDFWISFGTVFGLNDKSDDIQTRMIIGILF